MKSLALIALALLFLTLPSPLAPAEGGKNNDEKPEQGEYRGGEHAAVALVNSESYLMGHYEIGPHPPKQKHGQYEQP